MTDNPTTAKLLDAAEWRMRRGGYNAVSFRDLASDTGIKSSSVHYHFPKKEDLGAALVERYGASFFAAVDGMAGQSADPRTRLSAFRAAYRSALRDDDALCLCALLGAEMAGLPQNLAQAVRQFFQANIDWVAQSLPPSLSAQARIDNAQAVVASHQGAMMLANALGDQALFDRVSQQAIDQALAGCMDAAKNYEAGS